MTAPFLGYLTDHRNPRSLSARMRRKRFARFVELLGIGVGDRILDVGGLEGVWEDTPYRNNVTLLNIAPGAGRPGFTYVQGDGCDLSAFADRSFDVMFSNSVIEHVGGPHRHRAFAAEVRRVARRYWVQTPNRHFPLESHMLLPFFQYLPRSAQQLVGRHWSYSHFYRDGQDVRDELDRLHLLDRTEMRELFPDAQLITERALGLPKSLIAFRR